MVAKAGRFIAIRKPRARTGVVKKTSSVGGHKAPRAAFVHVQMNIYRRLAVESNTATAVEAACTRVKQTQGKAHAVASSIMTAGRDY